MLTGIKVHAGEADDRGVRLDETSSSINHAVNGQQVIVFEVMYDGIVKSKRWYGAYFGMMMWHGTFSRRR